jgi:hypothetical protein
MEDDMIKGLFALFLAGTLMVPHITPALGNGGTVGLGAGGQHQPQAESWATLPLPPVPHLEATPRLTSEFLLKGPKVDILLGPRVETLGPFLLGPSIPPRQFSSTPTAPKADTTND